MKVAVLPLGVSVPPAGVTLQVTAPEHAALAFTVAVKVEVAPVFIVVGLALTVTPLTVQVLPPPPPPPVPPLPPQQLDSTIVANTVDTNNASHLPTSRSRYTAPCGCFRPSEGCAATRVRPRPLAHGAIFDMIRSPIRRCIALRLALVAGPETSGCEQVRKRGVTRALHARRVRVTVENSTPRFQVGASFESRTRCSLRTQLHRA